ncbi:MAG: hypothetical protein L3J96_00490 [Thermoplasmata archaeon]|nr:hypothetical protein [Thermoplasmata archaeon]
MKPSRLILFWVTVIALLLLVEVAELTHLFTLPVQSALGNLLSFIFALVFTTILALVGAIFIGIYISQRLQSAAGFTPFEEEMLKMRADVTELRRRQEALESSSAVRRGPAEQSPEVPR